MSVEACLLSQKEFNLLWMKHDESKILEFYLEFVTIDYRCLIAVI